MDEWKRVTRPVPMTAPTPPTEWMSARGVARMRRSAMICTSCVYASGIRPVSRSLMLP